MKPHKVSKCGVCATPHFERNNYFYGKQFTVRDLLQEQSYFNDKRQLINRMVLGWGVVCGLDVNWDPKKREFIVETGMALDCCGHEIIVCEQQRVPFDDYEEHCRGVREKPDHQDKFVLCLDYDECHAEPVELPAVGCDDDQRTEFNRVRDGFKLRIKKWEDACPSQPYKHVACLNRYKHDVKEGDSESPDCKTEKIHHYLCRKLKEGCPECDDCACVILGTIYLEPGKPQPPGYSQDKYKKQDDSQQYTKEPGKEEQKKYNQEEQYGQPRDQEIEVRIDTCTDRRFVYNNSLLYDLIYCHHGDLPHIVDFTWRKPAGPTRVLTWETFAQLMKDGLTVYFDQKMEPASLNPFTFFITFFHEDRDSGNIFVKRIPAKEIRSDFQEGCYTAVWLPDPQWVEDEVVSERSHLADGCQVEITLRGSRIWDSRGKGLDGAFLADKLPTGNGTQGTEFIDWFRVLKRGAKQDKAKRYSDF